MSATIFCREGRAGRLRRRAPDGHLKLPLGSAERSGTREARNYPTKPYEGYSQEKEVDPNSTVETFAAIRLSIDNERWSGVPFTILAGKKLSEKSIEVEVQLKRNQKLTFQIHSGGEYETLLLDAIEGKRSQFVSYDEIDAAWELLDPALKDTTIFIYSPGSLANKLSI